MTTKPLHFGFTYTPHGAHPGAWRHPDSRHDPFDPAQITAQTQAVEAAGFTFIRFQDQLAPEARAAAHAPEALARTEAFTTASFLATRTKRLGFVVTGNTSYFEPFNLARLTASLDHVTHGRAGWELTSGASYPAARNYSQTEATPEVHYARAAEVLDILRKLWDSWEDDAFIRNKATGEYVDGDRIHPIHHEGERFRIKGPLNVARPPQGQVVVAHEITSDLSYAIAAQADLVFLGSHAPAEIRNRADAMREAVKAAGRAADSVRLFADVIPVLAATPEAAKALLADLNARAGQSADGYVIAGDAKQIADQIEALAETGGVNGINIRSPLLPTQLEAFVELVVPELKARGLWAEPKDGATLRDHLGLDRPANRLTTRADLKAAV
ncbi:LLM class flavin-dependent oxidoreductase [Asticcacaulis tiandongensis]|uniref:LLM class flavin-dependent oxidoreductase n=1 Tax=Asticcacaulis tiandongensis TaxID=2565365 RepID=UPI0011260AC3|nr:LLM class flavin-dependent oxidoreductase [Asticcacaulis tiandongensis]